MNNYKIEKTLSDLAKAKRSLEEAIVLTEELRKEFHLRLETLRAKIPEADTPLKQQRLKEQVDLLYADYEAALLIIQEFGENIANQKGI